MIEETAPRSFAHISHVIGRMGPRERDNTARVLMASSQPILKALAYELIAANAIESAAVAELDAQITAQHIAEMAEFSAHLPAPGTRTDEKEA
jgi:chitodextrinase